MILKISTTYCLLILILTLAACVRLYKIESPLYDWNAWRQTETAAIAMNYYQDKLPFLYPEIDWVGENGHAEMEFPIYAYLISLLYWFTTSWDTWGRIITLLFSVGTVYLLFDIGKGLYNPVMGLFAAAFFAASPLCIYYGRTFMPDPMMVFFSTLSIAGLLRWEPKSGDKWIYLSSLALSIGVLMKPPCLMVSFPLIWIVFKKDGWQVCKRVSLWISLGIIFIPAILWYTHANSFFQESKASFMWHFKEITFSEYILINWQWQNWEVILFERISKNILAYVGLFPLLIGMVRFLFSNPARIILLLWLIATFIYYAVIAAHHRGHDYYSLLPIVPLSLVCAYGCEWLFYIVPRIIRPLIWLIPAFMFVMAWIGLQQFDAYRQWYLYYQDAKAMQEHIPEDSLILVMDEILHTPEFFYFIDRNGWHRQRDPDSLIVDSEWVDYHHSIGADYYVGLNEAPGNHPLQYLQTHPMGIYIRDQYEIEYIGARFFLANLNKPVNPDLSTQTIITPAIIQAEDFLLGKSTLIPDPTADRGTALYAESQMTTQVVTYGPYFHFPLGEYDITYRIRAQNPDEEGMVEIAISDSQTVFASKRLSGTQDLSETYQDFTIAANIEEDFPLEIRMVLHPYSSVIFDTVKIHHKKLFDPQTSIKYKVTHLISYLNQIIQLTDSGMLVSMEKELIREITSNSETVEAIHGKQNVGWVWVSQDRKVYDQNRSVLFQLPEYYENESAVSIHQSGNYVAVLTNENIYKWDNGLKKIPIPQSTTSPRDIAVNENGKVYVLYGSGQLIELESNQSIAGLPNFGADVCRRLIFHQSGFYVVDALGAIHNTSDIPAVRSPYYKTEDWIVDAERTNDGQWVFLTRDGKTLVFEE